MYGGESSHLPLKINTAGVIPVIFASSILLLPNTMSGFGAGSTSEIFIFISSLHMYIHVCWRFVLIDFIR